GQVAQGRGLPGELEQRVQVGRQRGFEGQAGRGHVGDLEAGARGGCRRAREGVLQVRAPGQGGRVQLGDDAGGGVDLAVAVAALVVAGRQLEAAADGEADAAVAGVGELPGEVQGQVEQLGAVALDGPDRVAGALERDVEVVARVA